MACIRFVFSKPVVYFYSISEYMNATHFHNSIIDKEQAQNLSFGFTGEQKIKYKHLIIRYSSSIIFK